MNKECDHAIGRLKDSNVIKSSWLDHVEHDLQEVPISWGVFIPLDHIEKHNFCPLCGERLVDDKDLA